MTKSTVEVVVERLENHGYVKCPRCSQWHPVRENFDNLCDRCCDVMLHDWPQHPASLKIRKSYDEQRKKYS